MQVEREAPREVSEQANKRMELTSHSRDLDRCGRLAAHPQCSADPRWCDVMRQCLQPFRSWRGGLLLALCSVIACGWPCPPSDKAVAEAFLKEYPGAVVTSVSSVYPNTEPGRTGGDIVEKHIRFRTSSTTAECEVVWTYTDGVPAWTLANKSESAVPGTLCRGCTMMPCTARTS